ncbi:aspartate kinase [Melghirimyces profundicolus]|uniref:Aspartokinase n=1 Tax=Melghirimyces profundicolus TaxID=1242148 RepID=A0A2T6BTA7_9BACL|nr:aspartate kinase [Melghirimyces profundicolus]PTX59328.1 aspartate kinase [Melghirimyces profundicolus]
MGLVVQKFGGTSVGSVERIKHVAERVARTRAEGHQVVVTVSAMGKTTDELTALAGKVCDRPPKREMDVLLTTGEQVSISLLSMALMEKGVKARPMTGWQAGIQTDPIHGKARIEHIDTGNIRESLERGEVVVVAGFQGVSPEGAITTLGRGGSDTTAVALAAALDADRCEIYTDVTGVFTTDPRMAPKARKLSEICYEEMLELANLGAGVLHPRSVECAMSHRVPLVVRSSFEDEEGTWVKEADRMEEELNVRGIAHDSEVARVKVMGLPNRTEMLTLLFNKLADAHINVDMIVTSEHDDERIDVAFSVHEDELEQAGQVIESHREELDYLKLLSETGLAKVSAVGAGMVTNPGVAAKMFTSLSDAGIRIKMVSTSEIKISCVIAKDQAAKAVQELHTVFGLDVEEALATVSS